MSNWRWTKYVGLVVVIMGLVVFILSLSVGSKDGLLGHLTQGVFLLCMGYYLMTINPAPKKK